ncbi:MAG: hypothetical protein AAGF11_48645 [Myxococcota bacterium]
MKRFAIAATLLGAGLFAYGQSDPEITAIPHNTIEQPFAGGETHVYRFALGDPVSLRVQGLNGMNATVRLNNNEAISLASRLRDACNP